MNASPLEAFKATLLKVAPSASADVVERLKAFAEGNLPAAAIYQSITNEARPLDMAISRAKTRKTKQGNEAIVAVGDARYTKPQAEARLKVLRKMQEAALKDALEDEARLKAPPMTATSRPTTNTSGAQRAFTWKVKK